MTPTSRGQGDRFIAADVRAELQAHIDARIEENVARGLSMAEAEREARGRFGPVDDLAREATKVRHGRPRWHRALPPDLHQAWLSVSRRPLPALCALLVVIVGLTTAFASARVADAMLLRPPAGVQQAAKVFSMLDSIDGTHASLMSYETFLEVQRAAPDAHPFVWGQRDFQVISGRDAGVKQGELVSGSYFPALGTSARFGRLLDARDDDGHAAVTVVSWRLAKTLDKSADVVGQSIKVNGQPFVIVGVTAQNFQGIEAGAPSDLWLPMSSEPDISTPTVFPDGHIVRGYINSKGIGWLRGGVRIAESVSPAVLQEQLTAVARATDKYRRPKRAILLQKQPWHSPFSGSRAEVVAATTPLAWAVAFTLFLTAVCLGSLFVGRVADRQREIGVRLALGATRARVLRVVIYEIAIVLLIGALVAAQASQLVLAQAGELQLSQSILVRDTVTAGLDARSTAMLILMCAAVALVAMTGPLALLLRMSRSARIESARATRTGNRVRRVLLAAQIGGGCALISGAVLLTQSISALKAQPLGYNAAGVSFVKIDPAGAGFSDTERASLPSRLAAITWPADARFAYADQVPHSGSDTLFVTGSNSTTPQYPTAVSRVSANYHDVLGIRIVAGRGFREDDQARRVAIVSESLAKVYWPNGRAVGESIFVGGKNGVPHEVIGIAAGVRDEGLKSGYGNRLYLPFSSDAESLTLMASGSAASDTAKLLETVRGLDARLVPIRSGRLIDLAWRAIEQRLLLRFVTAIIGVGSVIMVAIGVWGLAHSNLRRRWREFGIRQALGADRGAISRLALSDAFFVSLVGGIIGVGGAWQIGVMLKKWLFGVGAHDPLALASGLAIVIIAALAGAAVPARRAANINAAELLRED